jgi:hypothetical protein
MVAEHDEALYHKREHQPRTRRVRLAATREKGALFIKDCQRAIAIACISQLSKNRSNAEPLHTAPRLCSARGLGMQQSVRPV